MLDRASARGEIASGVDREVVLDLFFGAAEHRLLLGHLPMSEDFIADVVDVILAGIRTVRRQACASEELGTPGRPGTPGRSASASISTSQDGSSRRR